MAQVLAFIHVLMLVPAKLLSGPCHLPLSSASRLRGAHLPITLYIHSTSMAITPKGTTCLCNCTRYFATAILFPLILITILKNGICCCCCCCLVNQLFSTLCDPMDSSPPGSSAHRISQARILEWIAISFSRESSRPWD